MRYTEYHNGVAVIKDKSLLKEAMRKLAKLEDAEEEGRLNVLPDGFSLSPMLPCRHTKDVADTLTRCATSKVEQDWISVDKELPPFGERLQATILHHEWIADYDSSWVPEKEKTYHQEYTEVCEIYPMGWMWFYACKEDEYARDVAYIKPKKDLGNPISEIIAWKPFPEAYEPEEG